MPRNEREEKMSDRGREGEKRDKRKKRTGGKKKIGKIGKAGNDFFQRPSVSRARVSKDRSAVAIAKEQKRKVGVRWREENRVRRKRYGRNEIIVGDISSVAGSPLAARLAGKSVLLLNFSALPVGHLFELSRLQKDRAAFCRHSRFPCNAPSLSTLGSFRHPFSRGPRLISSAQ